MDVYISHLGEKPLQGFQQPEAYEPGTLGEVLQQIDRQHPGFLSLVILTDQAKLRSSTLVYKNIQVDHQGRWLEGPARKIH